MESIYTLTLADKVSGKMRTITGTSDAALKVFGELQSKTSVLKKNTDAFGSSISTLRKRIDLLQAERDIIDPKNLTTIRKYNSEISRLDKQIAKLSTTRGRFRDIFSGVTDAIPGLGGVVSGGVLVGVGAASGISSAFQYQENLAKVNVTAQLSPSALADLQGEIEAITNRNKVDLLSAPVAFERILGQTNDLTLSLEILDSVQQGVKAGFSDTNTVADALARTMSIVGKEDMNAQSVLDTLFMAKKVGAGEFADFSRYIPSLTAGAKNLGVSFQDVAGTFAYMTSMGNSAERSAVLMENAYGALGRGDIQKGMQQYGVSVFDAEGKMRSLYNIATDLNSVLSGKSDRQRTTILEDIGLRDKEARSAFSILTMNAEKLRETLDATNGAFGETQRTLSYAKNPMMEAKELWFSFKNTLLEVGVAAMPVIVSTLKVVSGLFTTVDYLLSPIINGFKEGNPLVLTMAASIAAWTIALNASAIMSGILAVKTGILTTAQWALNVAMNANPIGIIVTGLALLVAGVVTAYQKVDWFRGAIKGAWVAVKGFGVILKEYVVDRITGFLTGISSVGKALVSLFKGDFAQAGELAKKGAADLLGVSATKNAVANAKALGGEVAKAYDKGVAEIASKKKSDGVGKVQQQPIIGSSPILAASGALSANAGSSNSGFQNRKGSTLYSAITSRMRQIALPVAAAASMAGGIINPVNTSSSQSALYSTPSSGKSVTIENININVASLDGKDKDDIVRIIEEAIIEALA